jgi:LAGLIDADG DNA endonuclease family/Proton-conducting membrane transporter
MNETAITIISLLLLMGAMAKSSQIPLHSWLPGSMEGQIITLNYNIRFFILLLIFIISYTIFDSFLNYFIDLSYLAFNLSMALLPLHLTRDKKGRFISKQVPLVTLPDKLKKALIGEMLGDGCLRFTKKKSSGLPSPYANALFAMTLKELVYATYLKDKIYKPIFTSTPLRPWPNPKTGKIPTQYAFSSKCLPSLTILHNEWYNFNNETKKFIKIVPLNIGELLTPIGLAHWLMGDGY